ncbi:aspartate aminotransferase family protein [Leucobacter musarum]|uniref:aspartate aminotransferase family protein n=1 Tax=Leucobacter musarum TaxID=1930747 RepID=UPI00094958A4|nr:aspartate aminotransferase family protein [Leucobacter musarum]
MSTAANLHMANSFDPARARSLSAADADLVARRQRSMGAAYRLFYDRPVHPVRGEGVWLYDADGNAYLDAYNNVPVVGHANPVVQQRVAAQLGVLGTHTRYLGDDVVDYAERLTGLVGHGLAQAVFVCTGSEAVDLALRVARHVTGRSGVIATAHAYHGTTAAAAAISPSLGPNNPIPTDVELISAPDLATESPEAAAAALADRVHAAVAALRARGVEPAALIIDSILSSDGLQGTSPGVLGPAAEAIRAHGGLYIADEVQPGFGRTGAWWGFPGQEVEPDLVVVGKPMGNGMPIAALFSRPEHLDRFGADMRFFNTFGGNQVSVAAGQAVLDELIDRDLVARAGTLGAAMLGELRGIAEAAEVVGDVRGSGLFFALDIVNDAGLPDATRASAVVNRMRDDRVLISASGPAANVLKIRPPLVFDETHAPRLLESLTQALRVVTRA